MDHPAAKRLYQSLGFEVFSGTNGMVEGAWGDVDEDHMVLWVK